MATGAAVAGAATAGLDFLAAAAATGAAATGAAAATGTASDFLETFFTAGAEVEAEAVLLIVLIPVEVFDINKRGMIFSTCKSVVKFCE